jgi:hypothetical protein
MLDAPALSEYTPALRRSSFSLSDKEHLLKEHLPKFAPPHRQPLSAGLLDPSTLLDEATNPLRAALIRTTHFLQNFRGLDTGGLELERISLDIKRSSLLKKVFFSIAGHRLYLVDSSRVHLHESSRSYSIQLDEEILFADVNRAMPSLLAVTTTR